MAKFSIHNEVFIIGTRNFGEEVLRHLHGLLDPHETARAHRFRFRRDRDSYVVVHGLLRVILGKHFDILPGSIKFKYNPFGKPLLSEPGENVWFSLSHSRDVSALSFSLEGETGIDIEYMDPGFDYLAVAEYCFSPGDKNYIDPVMQGDRERFFRLWTRKEALLKAIGTGISTNLDVEVFNDDHRIAEGSVPGNDALPGGFFLNSSVFGRDYMVSVACPEGTGNMRTNFISETRPALILN